MVAYTYAINLGKNSNLIVPRYQDIIIQMHGLAEKYFSEFGEKTSVLWTFDEEQNEHVFDISTRQNPLQRARKNLITLRIPTDERPSSIAVINPKKNPEKIYGELKEILSENCGASSKHGELDALGRDFSSVSFLTTKPSEKDVMEMAKSPKFNKKPNPSDMYPGAIRDLFFGYSWWGNITELFI